jgi:hypothetical protein
MAKLVEGLNKFWVEPGILGATLCLDPSNYGSHSSPCLSCRLSLPFSEKVPADEGFVDINNLR